MKSSSPDKRNDYLTPGKRRCHQGGWLTPNLASPLAMERWHYVDRIGWARCEPGFYFKRGEIDAMLLHFVLAGEMEHAIHNQWHGVRAGEACLMDLASPTAHRNVGNQAAELFWVSFCGRDLDGWSDTLQIRTHPVFRGVDRAAMLRLFHEIVRLIEERPAGHEAHVSMLLGGLLAELYTVRERDNPLLAWTDDPGKYSPGILAAFQIMHIEHSSSLTIRYIAEYAGLSPSRFAHRFRDEVGLSPMAWLNRFRIQRAQVLLNTTRRPVAEIARLVGLPDPAHFSRLFHRETGVSPRAYRRHQRLNDARPQRLQDS